MLAYLKRNSRILCSLICSLLLSLSIVSTAPAKVRPHTKMRTLQNGLHLAVTERAERPLVAFRILIRAGSKFDPPGKSGLASLTARLLRLGAGSRNAQQFQRYIDSVGVSLKINVTRDIVDISVTVLRKELFSGTRLIRDMLMEQRFDSESFDRQLKHGIAAVHQSSDIGYNALSDFAYQEFFSDSGYGASPIGNPENLSQMTLEDIKDFHKRYYSPERISITVAGDISAKDYLTEMHEALSPYGKNKHPENDSTLQVATSKTDQLEICVLHTPGVQGAKLGFFALCDSAANVHSFAAQQMLAHLLAGFPELSFLGRKLIEENDLVSNLRADLPFSPRSNLMEIQMDCTGDKVIDALDATIESLRILRESRVSIRELEEGKSYYKSFYDLGFETAHNVTERFAELIQADLSIKVHDTLLFELQSLTQANLRETSEKIFSPSNLLVVIRGDAEIFADDLRAYGKVRVISARKYNR